MPPLQLDENHAAYQIHAFQPGMIRVNEKTLRKSIIITPQQLIEDWPPQTIQELSFQSLAPIIPLHPDILLIGTGTTLVLLPIELYGELINQGIGVEIMDTSAACRTYNALSADNRNVAAALIIK